MRRFRRQAIAVCFVACAIVFPSSAAADQIDFRGVGHASVVSIGGIRTGTFWAGELNWTWRGSTPAGFANAFYSYCVDVSQNLLSPQNVTVTDTEGFTNGSTEGGAKAAWLVNQFAEGIRTETVASVANTQAAALQIAIWEAMYDNTANLNTGNFRLTNGSLTSSIRTQADVYLTALFTATGTAYNTSVATLLNVVAPNRGQDQIVARVAEPSTMLLMGVALLVFARRARRTNPS